MKDCPDCRQAREAWQAWRKALADSHAALQEAVRLGPSRDRSPERRAAYLQAQAKEDEADDRAEAAFKRLEHLFSAKE